jgi:beta-glucosidase
VKPVRRLNLGHGLLQCAAVLLACVTARADAAPEVTERRVEALLARMTVEEKIGQLGQRNVDDGRISSDLRDAVKAGQVGSVLNAVDVATANELQRIAVHESRLGIPLLVGRDVIHGFKTVLPIPLGQAAAWNPELVRDGARMAALEAAASGVNWTFAPMIDVSRDPRWGRIAESFGEDTYLTSVLGVASIQGFQGDDLARPGAIAACAKHFVGYGASEAGRDYGYVGVPEIDLRNVYMPPFKAALDAGVATFMTAFSDVNGIPATGNRFLMQTVLRDEWKFTGLVVSDWESVTEMIAHGFAASEKDAAFEALSAGVDMEMATPPTAITCRRCWPTGASMQPRSMPPCATCCA